MSARILLIDDDDITRELFSSLLVAAGHQVWELPSPIGATRTISANRIDIVILDIFMPQMDGDKSARMLRENPRLKDLGIILVSSCEQERLISLAERVGADAVVPKAEARAKLVHVVRQVIHRSRNTSRTTP
jgi:CheY-like chemotaxis protein